MFGKTFLAQLRRRVILATTINRPKDEVERLTRMRTAPPLQVTWAAGIPLVRDTRKGPVKARLIAHIAAGSYSWQGVYGTAGGGHADLDARISDNSGLEYAYEDNGNTTLTAGMLVDLERDPYCQEFRFQYDHC